LRLRRSPAPTLQGHSGSGQARHAVGHAAIAQQCPEPYRGRATPPTRSTSTRDREPTRSPARASSFPAPRRATRPEPSRRSSASAQVLEADPHTIPIFTTYFLHEALGGDPIPAQVADMPLFKARVNAMAAATGRRPAVFLLQLDAIGSSRGVAKTGALPDQRHPQQLTITENRWVTATAKRVGAAPITSSTPCPTAAGHCSTSTPPPRAPRTFAIRRPRHSGHDRHGLQGRRRLPVGAHAGQQQRLRRQAPGGTFWSQYAEGLAPRANSRLGPTYASKPYRSRVPAAANTSSAMTRAASGRASSADARPIAARRLRSPSRRPTS
jgi:hypothetical protein